MTGRLAGRTALVTGATKGIGLGIARAFVREGARVAITARTVADCVRVAGELGGGAVAIAADLTRPDDVRRLARAALAAFDGRVDILVNNAGEPRVAPSATLAEDDYRHTIDLNLTAYFLLSQELGRPMLERKAGVIINVTSITGTHPFPQRLAYCVSKAGANMLTKVMAIEWAAAGVRVNAIAPGYVGTEFVKGLAARGLLDEGALSRRTPLGRLGTPDEIGAVAVFLASDEASFITGEIVTADGGWTAYGWV